MKTNPILAAIAVVSSTVLMFGNTAQAKGPTYLHVPSYGMAEQMPDPDVTYQAPTKLTLPEPLRPKPLIAALQVEELPEPEAIAAQVEYPAGSSRGAAAMSSSGNTYVWGQCTWYAKNKRTDLPNGLGNGGQWVANAAARGFATGTTPQAGAIGEQPGHVVYVESVNGDGTVNISEMNYNGGVGVVHTRTVAASTFKYIY